jgi:hypothetical protein
MKPAKAQCRSLVNLCVHALCRSNAASGLAPRVDMRAQFFEKGGKKW